MYWSVTTRERRKMGRAIYFSIHIRIYDINIISNDCHRFDTLIFLFDVSWESQIIGKRNTFLFFWKMNRNVWKCLKFETNVWKNRKWAEREKKVPIPKLKAKNENCWFHRRRWKWLKIVNEIDIANVWTRTER